MVVEVRLNQYLVALKRKRRRKRKSQRATLQEKAAAEAAVEVVAEIVAAVSDVEVAAVVNAEVAAAVAQSQRLRPILSITTGLKFSLAELKEKSPA